jgi:hypothetical protein
LAKSRELAFDVSGVLAADLCALGETAQADERRDFPAPGRERSHRTDCERGVSPSTLIPTLAGMDSADEA